MPKISRVRTGCWTCKRRHRKCDETKPTCKNCDTTGRACEGYNVRYSFDTDEKKTRRGRTAYSAGSSSSNGSDTPNPGFSVTTFSTKPNQSRPELSPESLRQNTNGIFETPFKSESESLHHQSFPLKEKNHLEPFPSKENIQDPDENVDLETFVESNETSKKSTWLHENEDLLFSQIFGDSIPLPYPEMAGSPSSPHPGRIFDRDVDTFMSRAPKLSLKLSFQEENKLLKHFFKSLLPLLDAHPHSPWPNLALRYCDFNLARSCFISLACIHLYSKEGGHDYYKQGIAHINSTMQYLITYISNNEALEQTREQRYSQSFIILVLVNVHILFAVLDKGQSSLSRYLFEVFGSICSDKDFCQSLLNHESKGALIVVLSWYDTVSAVVSPDCRLPFCKPELYGSSFNAISTTQMMGCPGEIFRAMYEVCYLRHRALRGELEDNMEFNLKVQSIKEVLFGYRDYIDFNDSANYNLQLKGAQCWSLAVYITVLRIFKTKARCMLIKASVHEFIDVYGSMPSDSPLVTQMVWPLYAMACECTTEHEKDSFRVYMNKLNDNGPMGTLSSLRWIVKEVWRRNTTQEAVLESWLEDGVDYHPL